MGYCSADLNHFCLIPSIDPPRLDWVVYSNNSFPRPDYVVYSEFESAETALSYFQTNKKARSCLAASQLLYSCYVL